MEEISAESDAAQAVAQFVAPEETEAEASPVEQPIYQAVQTLPVTYLDLTLH